MSLQLIWFKVWLPNSHEPDREMCSKGHRWHPGNPCRARRASMSFLVCFLQNLSAEFSCRICCWGSPMHLHLHHPCTVPYPTTPACPPLLGQLDSLSKNFGIWYSETLWYACRILEVWTHFDPQKCPHWVIVWACNSIPKNSDILKQVYAHSSIIHNS